MYEKLYHYTNWQGLCGILDSQCLWATHFKFLNDSSELKLFLQDILPSYLCCKVLENLNKLDSSKLNQILERAKDMNLIGVEAVAHHFVSDVSIPTMMDLEILRDTYITSFCQGSDDDGLLSMWRSYGQDGGYAIVFDREKISELLKQDKNDHNMGFSEVLDVIYDENKMFNQRKSDVKSICDFVVDAMQVMSGEKAPGCDNGSCYSEQLRCMASYKHKGFREENEVRIACSISRDKNHPEIISSKEVLLRGNNRDVPYIKLFDGLGSLPIEKIIVGPQHNQDQKVVALQTKLINSDIEVKASGIPYVANKTA